MFSTAALEAAACTSIAKYVAAEQAEGRSMDVHALHFICAIETGVRSSDVLFSHMFWRIPAKLQTASNWEAQCCLHAGDQATQRINDSSA